MQWHRFLLVILVGGSLALPASAWPWSKKPQPAPSQPAPSQYSSPDQASSVTPTISAAETAAQRVKELIGTLKTDPNDSKRLSALQELRQYDPRTYRELVPALVEALQRDPRPELRTELIQTLGKLRPVSQEVGQALEQASANDPVAKVRLQARTTLSQYQSAGYRSGKGTPAAVTPSTKEPPLADTDQPALTPPPVASNPSPVGRPANRLTPAPASIRSEPPSPPPSGSNAIPRPLPPGPPRPTVVPADPPLLQTPPSPPGDQGPELMPPE